MPKENSTKALDAFKKNHPWPHESGIDSLFRFYRFNDDDCLKYAKHLFVEKKLYHSLPSQFNDPFECKPHFSWPKDPFKAQAIRQHLTKIVIRSGEKRKSAARIASKNMRNHEAFKKIILSSSQQAFGELRICSFTTRKENLLFWAHYADSHKGFCVEFDATKKPISYAYRVFYQTVYPEVVYPSPTDATAFSAALIKSKIWEYEEEYRTIFVPESTRQPINDGESLLLSGNEITQVYLGLNMPERQKENLFEIIGNGPFRPKVWQAQMSKSSFELIFVEL